MSLVLVGPGNASRAMGQKMELRGQGEAYHCWVCPREFGGIGSFAWVSLVPAVIQQCRQRCELENGAQEIGCSSLLLGFPRETRQAGSE